MAFSFSNTPGSSTPSFSFGGSSSPSFSLFGTSSSSAPSMTKTTSSPHLFGGAGAGGGGGVLSGSGPASSPSLFGSATGASSGTPTFSFGGSQGSQPGAATSGSLFGGGGKTLGFGSSFGAATAPSPGGFGAASSQPGMAVAGLGFGTSSSSSASLQQAPDDSAIKELQSVYDAFVAAPGNHRYRFQYLFLNVVENPAARQAKPPDVDELRWREAIRKAGGENNSDKLWPVVANGFQDLLKRKAAQDEAIKEHRARLEKIKEDIATLVARQDAVLRTKLEDIRWKHLQLCQKLLRVVRYVDALESRFVSATGNQQAAVSRETLKRLSSQLKEIESALSPGNGGGLRGNADALIAAARLRSGSGGFSSASHRGIIDPASLESAFSLLNEYADVLARLQEVLRRNVRDADVLEMLSKA